MIFLQPYLLWGTLAVVIPVVLHFWHQKKGRPLPWAATQWLTEARQQQQRGLQLDNVLLLLLRCLLLIVLAVLLSQPILNHLRPSTPVRTVYLVQPSARLVSSFRFELVEALKRGEELYWIDEGAEPVRDLARLPEPATFDPLVLQTAIDQRRGDGVVLHLYLLNSARLATLPAYSVPPAFRLHTVAEGPAGPRPFLAMNEGRRLFVNETGQLTHSPTPALRLQSVPVHSGPVRVLLRYRNPVERQTVRAALNALSDVQAIDLTLDETPRPGLAYDWILTDQPDRHPLARTLYIVSGVGLSTENVQFTGHSLTTATDERVANGQLPEWLGEQLVAYFGLAGPAKPLSQRALSALFIPQNRPDAKPQTVVYHVLLLLFIVLLIAERWMALRKNA